MDGTAGAKIGEFLRFRVLKWGFGMSNQQLWSERSESSSK